MKKTIVFKYLSFFTLAITMYQLINIYVGYSGDPIYIFANMNPIFVALIISLSFYLLFIRQELLAKNTEILKNSLHKYYVLSLLIISIICFSIVYFLLDNEGFYSGALLVKQLRVLFFGALSIFCNCYVFVRLKNGEVPILFLGKTA